LLTSARAQTDAVLRVEIRRVWEENFGVYGTDTVWRQLNREGHEVARCTVERLMRDMGLQGAVRGKRMKTMISNPATPSPDDHVNRQFQPSRPDALWVADFTVVATGIGFVYVAFVIDAFARRIGLGSVGDSYDNALAETVNGLYKAEVITPRGPWAGVEAVEFATLQWVDWFNHRRLLEPIGYIPPAEAEARYHETLKEAKMAA
jgi:transposase InsO family protein